MDSSQSMSYIDVFNGDADGICALIQLRLHQPVSGRLCTGVKRDIQLLDQLEMTAGDTLTVLDISLDKNREGLLRGLDQGAKVLYMDHHYAGLIPEHPGLTAHIDTAPGICTSMLMNRYLNDAYVSWAIVGTYGDNMDASASALASRAGLDDEQMAQLCELGRYINYNSYGIEVADLHFNPEDLYRILVQYSDPISVLNDDAGVYQQLEQAYREDMERVHGVRPLHQKGSCFVYLLPAEKWANRVSGTWANRLTNENPDCAHAIVTTLANGNYRVSVRAPLNNRRGADVVCREFPSGGGREAAAGINELPADMLDAFVKFLFQYYS